MTLRHCLSLLKHDSTTLLGFVAISGAVLAVHPARPWRVFPGADKPRFQTDTMAAVCLWSPHDRQSEAFMQLGESRFGSGGAIQDVEERCRATGMEAPADQRRPK